MKISDIDKDRISEAVKKAEQKTSGEIVPVILSRSDFYPAAHFRFAIIVGALFSFLTYYMWDSVDPIFLIISNLFGLIIGYLLGYIPSFKRVCMTKREVDEEVRQRAIEVFHTSNVSQTRKRTGIMIFISLLERRVEVIADTGINAKVEQDYWNQLVSDLTKRIAVGDFTNGLVESVERCAETLEANFPIQKDDENELSNEVITD